MANESGGHWKTLTEARKLTDSTKIPGVFETDIKRVNPIERMAVIQASNSGKSIKWLREKNFTETAVTEVDIGQQMTWTDDVEYTEVEVYMKRLGIQRPLDKWHQEIHGTYNNYRTIALLETEKKVMRRIGDRIIYGDYTYNDQWDGLHALVAERSTPYAGTFGTGSKLNIDQADTGLSLEYVRVLINAMLFGIDEFWLNPITADWFDAAYQEKGFAGLAYNSAGALGQINMTTDEVGKPITKFAGIPLTRTDYMMGETTNTGTGATSNARGKNTAGVFSMFGLKYGNILNKEPGISFAFGGTSGAGDLYRLTVFPQLEDYDAEGIRLITYGAVLMGSTFCLGRIADIADAALLV